MWKSNKKRRYRMVSLILKLYTALKTIIETASEGKILKGRKLSNTRVERICSIKLTLSWYGKYLPSQNILSIGFICQKLLGPI